MQRFSEILGKFATSIGPTESSAPTTKRADPVRIRIGCVLSLLAHKAPCCAAGDRYIEKLSDQAVVSREADEPSALGAGGEHVLVAAVAEYADGFADVALMNFQGNMVLHVAEAVKAAESGDSVLLSPTTSSFDQYTCFEERGDHFKKIINAL